MEAAGLRGPPLGEAPSPCLLWEMETAYRLWLGAAGKWCCGQFGVSAGGYNAAVAVL